MLTKMTARQARDNFSDLLGTVYYGKTSVAIEKKGRVFGYVVNPEEYQALQMFAKDRFFKIVEDIQKRNNAKNPDEVLRDVTKAVEEVRTANYAKGK